MNYVIFIASNHRAYHKRLLVRLLRFFINTHIVISRLVIAIAALEQLANVMSPHKKFRVRNNVVTYGSKVELPLRVGHFKIQVDPKITTGWFDLRFQGMKWSNKYRIRSF